MPADNPNPQLPREKTAVLLVDHGSVVDASNQLLVKIVEAYRQHSNWTIVEPAHMELAEPSLADAFARCVEQGAQRVIIMPYFLSPGRHSRQDIPRLAAQAAENHPGVEFLVTEPLGLHSKIFHVIDDRITESIGS